ncbi:hypothetical protein TNCV_4678071 [Trichonephila clavipes]|nr:hypothetical protein TNCV_4678071 [Trichonephila clavipes]
MEYEEIHWREPIEASLSDRLVIQLYLSPRIKLDFEPWIFRRSNRTVDIEPASSPKLGAEVLSTGLVEAITLEVQKTVAENSYTTKCLPEILQEVNVSD